MSDQQASVLARVKGAAIDGRLRVLRIRQRQFISLHKALVQHRAEFLQAIRSDDNYSDQEAQLVFGSALIELRNHYDALDFDTEFEQEYALAKGQSHENRRIPFGIAYIIPDSLTTFFGVLSGLFAALEAGTCVVVELENTLRKTPALLRQVVSNALDRDAVGFVSSRAPADFLSQCVIVDQTGNTIPSSAPQLLLSGTYQNVAVVDRTGDVNAAVREIVASISIFKGGSRYAVDLVFVNEFVLDDFTAALTQELGDIVRTDGVEGRKFVRSAGPSKLGTDIKCGKAQAIDGSPDGGDVRIDDKSTRLIKSKLSNRAVIICKATSLDDVIDVLNVETEPTQGVGALYIFGGPREAKYLSQYINSQASYVNHIPAQLMVGPMTPIGHAFDLKRRYTRTMFEMPSPQVVPGPKSHFVSAILQKADFIDKVAQKPLKPTGQAPSGAWGFFEQGIILGAMVYLLPILSMSTLGIGYAAWKGYQRVTM